MFHYLLKATTAHLFSMSSSALSATLCGYISCSGLNTRCYDRCVSSSGCEECGIVANKNKTENTHSLSVLRASSLSESTYTLGKVVRKPHLFGKVIFPPDIPRNTNTVDNVQNASIKHDLSSPCYGDVRWVIFSHRNLAYRSSSSPKTEYATDISINLSFAPSSELTSGW